MKVICSIVLMCLGGVLPAGALAQTIVWTDQDARRIQWKDVSSGDVHTIVQFPSQQTAYQIQYDPIAAKLYYWFFTGGASVFQRANLDGSEPENISTPTTGFFTINVGSRKLYWRNGSTLYRSELNGAGVESHTYPVCCLTPLLALGNEIFLGGTGGVIKGIWRADADGSNEQLLHESGPPSGVAYDPVEDKLYWAAFQQGIHRMNRDGTGFQQIVFAPDLDKIVVDTQARKLYWTDPGARVIQRSNLDGSNIETFVTASDAGNPNLDIEGMTIVYTSEPIPTLSEWGVVTAGILIFGAGLVVLRKRFNQRSSIRTPSASAGSSYGSRKTNRRSLALPVLLKPLTERQMGNTQGRTKVFGLFLSGVAASLGGGGLWASEALAQCNPIPRGACC